MLLDTWPPRVGVVLLALLATPAIVTMILDRSTPMTFTLLPAVDVADGTAVRLVHGAAGTETRYGDPREAALAWQRDGAELGAPGRPRRRVRPRHPTRRCWPR